MAEFFVDTENVGTKDIPWFRVSITMSNCGGDLNGGRKAVATCATVQELDEQVEALIKSLRDAQSIATGYLEENEGEL